MFWIYIKRQFELKIFPEDIKVADALNLQSRHQQLSEMPPIQYMNIKTLVPKQKNLL